MLSALSRHHKPCWEVSYHQLNWIKGDEAVGYESVVDSPVLGCGYLDDVKAAIESPDLVFQSTRDERSHIFYRLRVGRGDFAGKHLVIVIKYVVRAESRRGYVSTIYLSRAVHSRGPLLWPRTETAPQ